MNHIDNIKLDNDNSCQEYSKWDIDCKNKHTMYINNIENVFKKCSLIIMS